MRHDDHQWDELARYNAERSHGLIHTPEWDAEMAAEQARFMAWREAQWRAEGYEQHPNGYWIKVPKRRRWLKMRHTEATV